MTVRVHNLTIPRGAVGQALTVAGTVVSFAAFPAGTTDVFATVSTAGVWVTFDGVNPVAGSYGHEYGPGDQLTMSAAMAQAAKFIQATGASALVFATPLS